MQSIFPALMALCLKHEELPNPTESTVKLIGTPLDKAFYSFGKNFLGAQEGEVIPLISKGHSSKPIIRLLDISEDTVKVYRKHFHVKLKISSQVDLFPCFWNPLHYCLWTAMPLY